MHNVTKETINGTEYYNARYDLFHGEKGWSWRSKKSNTLATLNLEPSDSKYSRDEFVEKAWPKMMGNEMNEGQKLDIEAGCVGITSCVIRQSAIKYTQTNGGFEKLGLAQEQKKQLQLENPDAKYIIYSVRFYSPSPELFLPDGKGKINMTKWDQNIGIGINFDFGYLNEKTGLWWDANHDNLKGDMEVYQKTLFKFSERQSSFNRQIFVVAPSGL